MESAGYEIGGSASLAFEAAAIQGSYLEGGAWKEIPGLQASPLKAEKLRVLFTHQGEARSGLTEFELWKD